MKSINLLRATLGVTIACGLMGFKNPANDKWVLSSPDKKIAVTVSVKKEANQKSLLFYEITNMVNGKRTSVIEASPLGIERKDAAFTENLLFVSKTPIKTINEQYKMLIGRRSSIINNANKHLLNFENENRNLIQLLVRAYNDGVAFKYVFPETSTEKYTVTKELTGFKIPANGKAWISAYDKPNKWGPAYENIFKNGTNLGTTSTNEKGWAFPVFFKANGNWILLSEANLSANYCGVRFEQKAENGLYKIRFHDARDGNNTGEVNPVCTLPLSMSWRTITIGANLSTIFESEMVNNVSDAAFDETHLISGEPGKSIVAASRKGKDWYVAGINSESKGMDITLKMPFIKTGSYTMSLINDSDDGKSFTNQQKAFKAGEKLVVKMLGNGGFVATFKSK